MGKTYQYQLSPAVGRGVKERYAFLYESELVSVVSQGELYPDALLMAKMTLFAIRTGQHSVPVRLIFQ